MGHALRCQVTLILVAMTAAVVVVVVAVLKVWRYPVADVCVAAAAAAVVVTNIVDQDESCKISKGCFLLMGLHGVVLLYFFQFIHPPIMPPTCHAIYLCLFGCSQSVSQSTPTPLSFSSYDFFSF